ncbi:MAG: hypothetical protein WBH10_09695 [Allopontixanthobacter sediminis]
MYAFVDRPVTSLDRGGRFMVWAIRSWVKSVHEIRCPCTAIGPAFAQGGIIAGLPHFHMFMLVLSRNSLETFRYGQLQCNRVHEHEALVLSLISGIRLSRPTALRSTAALMIEEDAVNDLIDAAVSLGSVVSGAGLLPGLPGPACVDPDSRRQSF